MGGVGGRLRGGGEKEAIPRCGAAPSEQSREQAGAGRRSFSGLNTLPLPTDHAGHTDPLTKGPGSGSDHGVERKRMRGCRQNTTQVTVQTPDVGPLDTGDPSSGGTKTCPIFRLDHKLLGLFCAPPPAPTYPTSTQSYLSGNAPKKDPSCVAQHSRSLAPAEQVKGTQPSPAVQCCMAPWSQPCVPGLTLTSYMIVRKLTSLSEPQFPHLLSDDNRGS